MGQAIFWSDVQIDVSKTLGTALVLTAVTKANPAVATYTGTDPVNGTMVIMAVQGMTQLTDRVFRIANVDTVLNTFEIEGEDSTTYRTFISGTATPVTEFVGMTTVQDIDASGGDPEYADTTTVHQSIRSRAPTVFSASSYKFGCIYDPADLAMVRLVALSNTKSRGAIVFTFADNSKFVFYAYVGASGVPVGSAQEVVKTQVSLEAQGRPKIYAAV